MATKIDPKIRAAAEKVTAKRPRTVIDHILAHGHITTQELSEYGYNHPPRAARDVREAGIPLETFKVKGKDGRSIAAYRFGDPSKIEHGKLSGRRVFSKELKNALYAASRGRCDICQTEYESRYLQIDHRVPYEVAGDSDEDDQDRTKFMLLCGSCQRSKSWTCEHCENWTTRKDEAICRVCYWASPEGYDHAALREMRRLDISWVGEEVPEYEALRREADDSSTPIADLAKEIIRKNVKRRR